MSIGSHDVIALVNKIRAAGLHQKIDLPTIVLCGQQSCGKSSLSEAISSVPLPRNHGTCTRAPTEVRLINTEHEAQDRTAPWTCSVFVRWEWNDVDQCPLREHELSEQLIGSVDDARDVPELVSQAQQRLLSVSNVKFSRNVVCVEVRSPDCVDLTLVDLPGLIQAVENKADTKYIRMVQSLVESYLCRPNTVIAAVISCKDDMENQVINSLIRRFDKDGTRSLGILTKVDTIEPDCEDSWIDVLEGRKYPLRLGYVAVRNPSLSELSEKSSFSDARKREADFFTTHPVWSNMDMRIRERFGSTNLIKILSETLSKRVIARLPQIRMQVLSRMTHIRSLIDELPNPPRVTSNTFSHADDLDIKETIVDLVLQFADAVKSLVRQDEGVLWQKVMSEYRDFFRTLQDYTPQFDINEQTKLLKGKERAFTLRDVQSQNSACTGRKLPFNGSDDSARKHFIENSIKSWEMCARQLVNAVTNHLASIIENVIRHKFSHFRGLHERISHACRELIDKLREEALAEVFALYEREKFEFTLCSGRLQSIYSYSYEHFNKTFSALLKDKRKSAEKEMNQNMFIVMSEVRAYYEIAYQRFGDVVPMAINSKLICSFSNSLENYIFKSVNVLNGSHSHLLSLLQEDPAVAERRDALNLELERLSSIGDELRSLIPDENDDLLFGDENIQPMNHRSSSKNDRQTKFSDESIAKRNQRKTRKKRWRLF